MTEVRKEFERARAEGKQTLCAYCGAPLGIVQFYSVYTHWSWVNKNKIYRKDDTNWEAETPFCDACETED